MVIMQGDSYPIFFELVQDGCVLTPDMLADVEVCVGETITKKASNGEIGFDENLQKWYFRPTQEETLALEADESYDVIARVKYAGTPADVKGVRCGNITVMDSISEEVI